MKKSDRLILIAGLAGGLAHVITASRDEVREEKGLVASARDNSSIIDEEQSTKASGKLRESFEAVSLPMESEDSILLTKAEKRELGGKGGIKFKAQALLNEEDKEDEDFIKSLYSGGIDLNELAAFAEQS